MTDNNDGSYDEDKVKTERKKRNERRYKRYERRRKNNPYRR